MFMDNPLSTGEQLISIDNNLRTPSPLSSDSNNHASSESLLSEINEVYNSIDSNYQLSKTRTSKNLGIINEKKEAPSSDNSSPTSLKKRLSNVHSRLPDFVGYTSRSISKDVFSHLQTQNRIDEEEETDFIYENKSPRHNHKTSTQPDPRTNIARARRRAKMYSSSSDRSFKGTSSEEDDETLKISSIDYKNDLTHTKIKKSLNPEIMNFNLKMNFSDKLSIVHLHKNEEKTLNKANKKFPRLLEPFDVSTRRRKRRKNEVLTSSSMSYSTSPEPTQRRKPFASLVPHLNLQNDQSTDPSLLSTNREQEETVHQRNIDIDELVETLSNINLKPNNKDSSWKSEFRAKSVPASSRIYKTQMQRGELLEHEQEGEESSRTFRINKEHLLTPKTTSKDPKKVLWELKPTNAATNLQLRQSEISICPFDSHSNASTQVNMRRSLSSLQNSRHSDLQKKSEDRLPFTISETSTLAPQHHYKNNHHPSPIILSSNLQIPNAEVIYENKNCKFSSSSDSTGTYLSSTGKNIPSSSKTMSSYSRFSRSFEHDDRWVRSVSYLPPDGNNHSQDRYSVFFVKDSQIESILQGNSEDHLPCVHKNTCKHGQPLNSAQKSQKIRTDNYEDDPDIDLPEECFCLKFCNLFRNRSQMMRK